VRGERSIVTVVVESTREGSDAEGRVVVADGLQPVSARAAIRVAPNIFG